jgi:NAD(P)-dependent dehydrogenase (short-subunit alcohol dehydrogenase family)
MRGLNDRIVVVAGAATGIGAASAGRLAEEGAKVVVGDINLAGAEETAHAIESAGGTAIAVHYDQADDSSVAKLIAHAVDHFGGLHGLHANAADGRDTDLLDMDIAVWERTLRVDLIGYAVAIREALPHLLAAGGGGIVCTSSDACSIGEPTRPAYAAAKAGVNALIRHVASRWGKEGIRANAIAPGMVLTETAKREVGQDFLDEMRAAHRSPRLGEPTDIAAAVAYLLSDDGEWVNGQVWSVDGGVYLRD